MPNKEDDNLPDVLRQLKSAKDGYTPPPDQYFLNLAERSLHVAKAPAVVKVGYRRWLAVAASVLVLLLAGWWIVGPAESGPYLANDQPDIPSSDELLADIEAELIDAYVTEQIDEFTLELYAEAPLQE